MADAGISTRLALLGLSAIAYANVWLLGKTPAGQQFDDIERAMAWANLGLGVVVLTVVGSIAYDLYKASERSPAQ